MHVSSDLRLQRLAKHDPQQQEVQWCTSCNNGQGEWGFHWKDGHEEWKINQGKETYLRFYNLSTNVVIYCSYLMTTSEDSAEEEVKGGGDSQNNDFIYLSRFELLG